MAIYGDNKHNDPEMEHKYTESDELNNWICTDPDNLQYCSFVGRIFTYKEFDRASFQTVFNAQKTIGHVNTMKMDIWDIEEYWIEKTIDITEYTLFQMTGYIKGYYSDLGEVVSIYGEGAEQIIAECIFEQESGLY